MDERRAADRNRAGASDVRRIETADHLILDRSRAADLRHKYLDGVELDPDSVIFVDLSGMRAVTPGAADELLVHWLGSTPDAPTVAVVTADPYVQQSIDAALSQEGRAMYVLPNVTDIKSAQVVGFLDEGKRRLVARVQGHGEIGVTDAAKELNASEDIANKALNDLEHQGLLHRRGAAYIDPFVHRG